MQLTTLKGFTILFIFIFKSLPKFNKMNDLLTRSWNNYVDLKRAALKEDLEAGPEMEMVDLETEQNLGQFFEEVSGIKADMETIKELLEKLKKFNEETKSIHKASAMKSLRDRMDRDVVSVLKTAREIKGKLEALDEANMANRRVTGCEEGTPTDRTRTSVTNGLRKKLKDLMGEFQSLRQKVAGEYRETIERRYFTITGENASEETIEKIISTGESETFLQKAIQEQGRGQILDTIHEIQERHDAAKEIEKSLLELHQIFLDMAVLVEAQGEQLNDIEHHVIHAANYVDHGTKQLKGAKKYQRNTRKWMCIGIILLLILVFIIVIPIATSFKKS